MKKLRLLLWQDCNKNCPGCCNKEFDLDNLERVEGYNKYDEIYLTGGEPMLYSEKVLEEIREIRRKGFVGKLFMYTAKVDRFEDVIKVLEELDGLTVTLHNEYQNDVEDFLELNERVKEENIVGKSFRLNIFEGVEFDRKLIKMFWKVKDNMKWVVNCPIPDGEEFKRI